MEQYQTITKIIAVSMGVAWASGRNLYAVLLVAKDWTMCSGANNQI